MTEVRDELMSWWMQQAEAEAERTIPKAVEYGSNSMLDLGQSMARAMHRQVGDEEAMELACFFYMQGKMGRWLDAIVAGRRPGDDTPFDIGVYAKMVQRIREAGAWPGHVETTRPASAVAMSVMRPNPGFVPNPSVHVQVTSMDGSPPTTPIGWTTTASGAHIADGEETAE